jgi:hypothetical protein
VHSATNNEEGSAEAVAKKSGGAIKYEEGKAKKEHTPPSKKQRIKINKGASHNTCRK